MTVLDTPDSDGQDSNQPIKFPGARKERRLERMKRKQERGGSNLDPDSNVEFLDIPGPFPVAYPEVEEHKTEQETTPRPARRRMRWHISWTFLSFLLMVGFPGAVASLYFLVWASPQYMVETQFSVRGSNSSSIASFGLSGLFGTSVQSGDSYIVTSYIDSIQLVRDMKEQLGVDLRQYYSKNDIDYWYRISPDMPLEKFTDYWSGMNEISFNSTTGNVTLYIFGFSADDAKAIADSVLKVSEKLVNDLSEKNRQQMTSVASKQVERSENRLRKIRDELSKLRKQVEIIDPKILVERNAKLTDGLETQLQGLKTRQMTLLESVSKDAPSARMLQKQINALQDQIASQKSRISKLGQTSGQVTRAETNDANVAEVVDKFEGLTIDQDFATKAYTTSLAAFEAALSEAQKQERYFATFVQPVRPQVALYPTRLMDTFVALLVLVAIWLISQFLYRSFRDHAI